MKLSALNTRKLFAKIWRQAALALLLCGWAPVITAEQLQIPVLYLEQQQKTRPTLSNVAPPPGDAGLRGAELGIQDNNTTGRFLKHDYQLQHFIANETEALLQRILDWLDSGQHFVILNVPAETARALATHPAIRGQAILFNAGSAADELRTEHCSTGLLHTLPSRSMLADALAQFLIVRRWNRWLLVQTQHPKDQLVANAYLRSAKRFGAKIIDTKTWSFATDLRRQAQREVPAFTRAKDHHFVLVADEAGDIGEFIPFNTWLPRPVGGTQGLTPVAWHAVVEQWGALQLQSRFVELAQRSMVSRDYAAWLAVRSIGEAVTRTGSTEPKAIYHYILSEDFELAAFKGRKLNYRGWNGQLRQPIPLVHPRALVSQSPQEGFLHPNNEMDTLGFDAPEVNCQFSNELQE